jgi:hypothetical protein
VQLHQAIVICALASLPSQAFCEEFTSLAAHQHGHAIFSLAMEGEQVFIEFTAPAINIFGMEQQPKAAELISQVEQKSVQLKAMQWLTLSDAAKCKLQSVDLFSDVLAPKAKDSVQKDAESIARALFQIEPQAVSGHSHDSAHDHDHEHDHEHDKDKDKMHQHNDVTISAIFQCTAVTKLSEVHVNIWPQSYDLEQISAQWIISKGQGAATLTKTKPTIRF